MKKLCLILLLAPVCAGGCTTTYLVHVNGFSERGEPIKENASIYVSIDPNSGNPIFDDEIKAKIELLLKQHGYIPAVSLENSDYRLAFKTGLDSHRVTGYMPLYRPYFGFYDRYWGYYDFGYYGYVPYFETYYDQWLVMKVFSSKSDGTGRDQQVVWIGEAMLATAASDVRRLVNYLLIAGFEYFGQDTGRQMVVEIEPDDPRVLELEAFR
jgi:hypothetical protein